MIEDLIQFYTKELGSWNLVIKYNKKLFVLFIAESMLTAISIFFSFIYGFLVFAFFMLLFLILLYLLNRSFKKTINKKYGIKLKGKRWNGTEFHNFKKRKLQDYLENKKMKNEVKLEKIIKTIEKRIDNRKISTFFLPTIFVGLFYPAWSQFLSAYFRKVDVFGDQVKAFVSITVGVIYITFIVSLWKENIMDILSIKRDRLKELVLHLETIVLELPECNGNK
jgi:hypothetical protein